MLKLPTETTHRNAAWGSLGSGTGRSRTSFRTATTSGSRNYWSPSCSTESAMIECTDRTSSSSLDCRTARKIPWNRTGRTCWWLRLQDRKPRSRNRVYISADQYECLEIKKKKKNQSSRTGQIIRRQYETRKLRFRCDDVFFFCKKKNNAQLRDNLGRRRWNARRYCWRVVQCEKLEIVRFVFFFFFFKYYTNG